MIVDDRDNDGETRVTFYRGQILLKIKIFIDPNYYTDRGISHTLELPH